LKEAINQKNSADNAVIPVQAGIQIEFNIKKDWIPVFTGIDMMPTIRDHKRT